MQITCVVGARPQFIKLSPFLKAAEAANHDVRIIHTGQHYDDEMSCLLYTSPSPRDRTRSRMPSSA